MNSNNNNENNNTGTNMTLTWEISASRYHSAEQNARIIAAMEREYRETGGEYDTDFSDDDEIYEQDEVGRGETKEN